MLIRFVILWFVVLSSGCFQQVRDLPPTIVRLPEGATEEQVGKAVKLALIGRGWEIERETASSVDAIIDHRLQRIVIRVLYTSRGATIHFVAGREAIIENRASGPIVKYWGNPSPYLYERWVANLAKDIPVHLRRNFILGD